MYMIVMMPYLFCNRADDTLPRCSIPHLCGAIPADEKYRCKPTDQVHNAPWVVGHVTCYQCSYRSQPECVQRTGRSSGF